MATTANYQWFFLSAGPRPQHMIAADPGFWVREQTAQLIGAGASIEPEVMEDYIRCFRDPRGIAAVCADFRASPGPDLAHDEESIAAGQKVECPVLVLWGTHCPPATSFPKKHQNLVVGALRDFLD